MKKLFLLTPVLLLAACAPTAATGTASSNPQVMDSALTPVKIKPGETKYVRYDYSRSAVKVNDQFFKDLKINFNDRSGNNVSTPSAYAPWLKMAPVTEEGVSVSLAYPSIVKDVVNTENSSSSTNVQYYELVRVTLKVVAEASAKPGLNTVKVTFTDGSSTSTVPVLVAVQE